MVISARNSRRGVDQMTVFVTSGTLPYQGEERERKPPILVLDKIREGKKTIATWKLRPNFSDWSSL